MKEPCVRQCISSVLRSALCNQDGPGMEFKGKADHDQRSKGGWHFAVILFDLLKTSDLAVHF